MKKHVFALVRFASVALAILVGSITASAQFRTSIQGTVTDPDGAVVGGAKLTLKNNATNQVLNASSDNSGTYNFNALPADRFTLTATAPGFKQKVIENLQVIPEQPNAVNVQLELGEQSTTITVSGETQSAVDTETSNIGATVDSNLIQHAPSFNRDVLTLTQLAPGAVSDGSQGASGGVYAIPGNQGPGGSGAGGSMPTENRPQANANGQQNQNNGISIDGISTVSAVWGGASIITPSEESVDNVRIVTNDYDAENGRFNGAQTLVTSKSGTNNLHGSAFIAIHRPGLNAYQRAVHDASGNVVGKPQRDTQRFNQYGASLGGPLIKDKIFAFFAFEASPNSSISTGSGWYETPAFAALANPNSIASKYLTFPGSGVSSTGIITSGETCASIGLVEGTNCRTIAGQGLNIGSPLTSALGTQDLTATGTSANPGVGSGLANVADIALYSTSSPSTSYYRQFNGRLDANVSSKDRLSFAIYWVPSGSVFYNGGSRAYNLFHHDQINEALSVIWNHTFTPSFLNEARANAAGWRWNEIASNPQAPVGLAQAQVAQIGSITLGQFGSSLGSVLNQWTYSYKDVATKIIGPHTVKFGGDYTNLHYLNNPVGRPSYRFYNIWDFLNDAPYQENGGFNSVTGQPGGNRSDNRENLFGFFVQDDWKALPTLTLHAGVRYSYFGSLYSKQNNLPVANFGSGSAMFTGLSIRVGGNLWNPQKANFGPQVGFNWSPLLFNGNMTIRGGYGLNYNQEEIAISANAGNNPPTQNFVNYQFQSPSNPGTNGANIIYGISSSPTSLNGFATNPHAITSYNSANLPTAGNANVIIIGTGNGSLPTQYAHHFSLDTQYQIGHQLVASLGYQGSLSRHMINHQTPNSAAVVAGVPLNPLVTGGDYWTSGGSGNNNALLLELKHPFVHHFTADAQFQWAKSMDTDGSGPYYEDEYYPWNAAYSYGRSDFDVGKSFKLYGLWQPVIFHGSNNWAEKVVGGWSLSGILQLHTGFPFSPNYGIPQSLYCSQCGYFNLRPYYLGGGGNDHSNKAFETGSNFAGITANEVKQTATVNGNAGTTVAYSNKFFAVPNFASSMQAASGTGFPNPNVALPPRPGLNRNAFTGPGYRDIDASLSKAFGLPNTRLLGESAKFEVRVDTFNLFNIKNLDPGQVRNNVNQSNFGQDTNVLGARTVSFQGRFSF
jgi:hypothetical protein